MARRTIERTALYRIQYDSEYTEYRVTFAPGFGEAAAYYTDDDQDARDTARKVAGILAGFVVSEGKNETNHSMA